LLIALGVRRSVNARWLRSEIELAAREMSLKQHDRARRRLEGLAARRHDVDEVSYLRGVCELALGRIEAAAACWRRVPPASPFAERAALYREQVALAGGRFAEAEEALTAALRTPGPLAQEVRRRLTRLLRFQGRDEDVASLLEVGWTVEGDPVAVLRERAALDLEPLPVEAVRGVLEQAARQAPEDDRVWLGRATLATRFGQADEAASWLSRCQARRPTDPVLWGARLSWAVAAGQPSAVREALTHLPAGSLALGRVLALRAWVAARRNDPRAERDALQALTAHDPGDISALERLAGLAAEAGEIGRVESLRRLKAEKDRARRLYRSLVSGPDPGSQLAELGRLAQSLGRVFEARGWWALQARREPGDREAAAALARLSRAELNRPADDWALADLRSELARAAPETTRRPGPGATPRFVDDAEAAGLRFVYQNGQTPLRQIPETMGGGVALLDYDGDGWLDVYCVQGGPFPPEPGCAAGGDRLFRNRGDGTFEDATARAGIAALPARVRPRGDGGGL
jgi:tetratricopeptide (TPR) repeat protein